MPAPYDFLTAGCKFRVIDFETTTHERIRWAVALAIVEVNDGIVEQTHSWLINPMVPIDEVSQHIHGITDEAVADAPTFDEVIMEVYDALTDNGSCDTILVAHNAGFDVRVLFREFTRATVVFPDLYVLDTYTLPRVVGLETLHRKKLSRLATELNFEHTHHDATSDAQVTAQVLVHLLKSAHTQGITDIPELLSHAEAQTTLSMTAAVPDVDDIHAAAHPKQADEHVAGHVDPPAQVTRETTKAWSKAYLECASVGCEYVRVMATGVEDRPRQFLERLGKDLAQESLDSLTVNTALGGVTELVRSEELPKKEVFGWFADIRKTNVLWHCTGELRCPDCREGRPCPADVFYQSVAWVLAGRVHSSIVPKKVIKDHTGAKSPVADWTQRGCADVAGHVVWMCMEQAAVEGNKPAIGKLKALVHKHLLDASEPRLTAQSAARFLTEGKPGAARQLVDVMLAQATTDPAFEDLRQFRAAHLLDIPEPPARVLKGKPRTSPGVRRPAGRVEPPRFKLG